MKKSGPSSLGSHHHRHSLFSRAQLSKDKKTIIIMPLVDITNDIKRSIKKQHTQQKSVISVGSTKLKKKQQHKIDVVESPSHLREISVERRKEDEDDDDAPPTRGKSRSSGVHSNNTSSSPFSKVSVEGPGEFLDSEPSLSAKSSSSDDATISSTKSATKENEAHQQQQNQPQLRQSRRQKHQPQRLGDLLEWNDIKSNALYEKYDPEREQRLLEQVQMEKEKLRRIEEEEKNKNTTTNTTGTTAASHNRRTSGGKKKLGGASGTRTSASHGASAACESSCYRSGQQSEAALEVHQRVADLMKMAEQMLPPEEEEEVDDGLPKKSIREKLRDAWDGEGYYAKLMKEQDGPSSSSSSSSSGNRNTAVTPVSASAAGNTTSNSGKKVSTSKSNKNNNNSKKEGLKVYCDKENPVAHKVNRAKKANDGGLGSASSGGKLAPVGCGNNAAAPLVQRTALASALGNVTNANASSSSSTSNTINNTTISSAYMFGNLKTIQAPHASSTHSVSSNSERSTSPQPSSSASASRDSNETLLALKAENDLLRKQRNDVKLQHLKLKKELDDLKKNARIAVSKLCAKLPNNSRGVELDALAFLKLTPQ